MQADTSTPLDGMAMEQQLHSPIKTYFPVSTELTVQEYLLMKDYYILIVAQFRDRSLDQLHAGHQGIIRMSQMGQAISVVHGLLLDGCWRTLSIAVQHAARNDSRQ